MSYASGKIVRNEGCNWERQVHNDGFTTYPRRFMVNTEWSEIPVYTVRTTNPDDQIKFLSPSGYANGWSPNTGGLMRDIASLGVRLGTRTIDGKLHAWVRARRALSRFGAGGNIIGDVVADTRLFFDISQTVKSTHGANNPHFLLCHYYEQPDGVLRKTDPNASYGWIHTESNTRGFSRGWGIVHTFNA